MDMQVATVTKTTDKTGYFTYSFPKPIDEVMVSVNSPQGGTNKGVVSVLGSKDRSQYGKGSCLGYRS